METRGNEREKIEEKAGAAVLYQQTLQERRDGAGDDDCDDGMMMTGVMKTELN